MKNDLKEIKDNQLEKENKYSKVKETKITREDSDGNLVEESIEETMARKKKEKAELDQFN